ncbi:MAG: threonylcarbamoyl-AMP synthase [Tannerellaceae bacterium]|jgi:L-threonylcarbamoyladenylate synthase|nr:threonylcarbamoyl-AMP synthase [Tannerellaceae bacterium]
MTEEIKKACEVMRSGGIILYPTDTIWGIGCDATNEKAVQKVYELKQRFDNKAMLVLIDTPAKLEIYVDKVPEIAWQLIEVADKPLTIIYEKGKNLAENLPAKDGSIGIRVTNEAFSHALCERFHKPVVSTSANVSGKPSPAGYCEISSAIKEGVDYIVNYRRYDRQKAAPSSIIRLGSGGIIQVIRR